MKIQSYIIIGLIVVIINLNIINSLPLTIINSTINLNLTKDISQNIMINITNNNIYTLYDIIIEGDIVINSQTILELLPNSSKILEFNIKSSIEGIYNKSLRIIGFTKLNCSAIEQQTYDINITTGGTNPRNREICKNDNIKFENNYGLSIFVSIPTMNVYQGVSDKNSYVQNFPSVDVVTYRIEPLVDVGVITIRDIESKVHNTENDGFLTLLLNVKLEETNLTMNINKKYFNLSYNIIESSYIIIRNTGNKVAEKVSLFCDWLSFDKNNFNINPGEEKAINFVVSSIITKTEDTNKTYIKTLLLKSNNAPELRENITIFVNYGLISGTNISTPEWWIRRKEFCTAYPQSPDCLTEPYVVYRDKIIYDAPPILVNISPESIKRYLDMVNELSRDWSNYNNNWKLDTDAMKNGITDFRDISNLSYQKSVSNENEFTTFKNVFYIIMGTYIFLLLLVIVSVVLFVFYKNRRLKQEDII